MLLCQSGSWPKSRSTKRCPCHSKNLNWLTISGFSNKWGGEGIYFRCPGKTCLDHLQNPNQTFLSSRFFVLLRLLSPSFKMQCSQLQRVLRPQMVALTLIQECLRLFPLSIPMDKPRLQLRRIVYSYKLEFNCMCCHLKQIWQMILYYCINRTNKLKQPIYLSLPLPGGRVRETSAYTKSIGLGSGWWWEWWEWWRMWGE